MSECIIYNSGVYNLFDETSNKALHEPGLTPEGLRKVVLEKYDDEGVKNLPPRLARAHKHGCSSFRFDLEDCIERSGMTEVEFIRRYLTLSP